MAVYGARGAAGDGGRIEGPRKGVALALRGIGTTKMKTTAWVGGAIALLLSVAVTEASEILRGTIENLDGGTLVVKTPEGTTRNVRLADDANIYILNPASVADLKPGRFAGVITRTQADSGEKLLEIYISDSDLSADPFDIPTSGLATRGEEVLNYVEGLILENDGKTVTVRRGDIDEIISLSAAAVAKIVVVAPATVTDIKVGQKVYVPNGEPVSVGMVAPTIVLGE